MLEDIIASLIRDEINCKSGKVHRMMMVLEPLDLKRGDNSRFELWSSMEEANPFISITSFKYEFKNL